MASRTVIVLGSGAAGMAAGLAAAVAGARVVVLERSAWLGGTTAISGAGIWIPANPWAAAMGASDSVDEALTYLGGLRLGDVDPVLSEAYVRHGVSAISSIEEHAGVAWRPIVGMPDYHCELPGGSRFGRSLEIGPVEVGGEALSRVRPDPYGQLPWTILEEGSDPRPDAAELDRRATAGIATRGRGLIAAMSVAIERHGGVLRTGIGQVRLVMSGRAVGGVDVDGERIEGSVVLATGGFERDPGLVASFLRGPILAPAGPPSNAGDGLRLGMSAGAALGNMSEAWWAAALGVPGESIDGAPFFRMMFHDPARPGGLVVDRHGRRFANEATNYNDFGRTLHEVHAADFEHHRIPSWLVFDEARYRAFPLGFLTTPPPDGDWLFRADTVAELAEAIGVDPVVLDAEVEQFNRGALEQADKFGRGSYVWDQFSSGGGSLRPLDGAPFYAAKVLPGCLGTKGGMKIDTRGRVLGADGCGPIDGLLAAGNAAANPFGCAYPGPGSTVGPALVFGTFAGEAAAE
jgi:succinate dehydrogenase/fumarate reductase flavoprotein subunit